MHLYLFIKNLLTPVMYCAQHGTLWEAVGEPLPSRAHNLGGGGGASNNLSLGHSLKQSGILSVQPRVLIRFPWGRARSPLLSSTLPPRLPPAYTGLNPALMFTVCPCAHGSLPLP